MCKRKMQINCICIHLQYIAMLFIYLLKYLCLYLLLFIDWVELGSSFNKVSNKMIAIIPSIHLGHYKKYTFSKRSYHASNAQSLTVSLYLQNLTKLAF